MYRVHIAHVPALGKAQELRAALEDHVKASKAAGSAHALTQWMFASEPTMVNIIRHESLAALEEYGVRTLSDPAYLARTARISACLARPQSLELYEELGGGVMNGTPSYVLLTTLYAAPGKVGELRAALEKRTATASPGAVGKAVITQIAPPNGENFRAAVYFSSLAGYQEFRTGVHTNTTAPDLWGQFADLTIGPPHQQLGRILASLRP